MTQIVGIINVTPDSFSDGGEAFTPAAALDRAQQLINQGAEILDVGAESTRPHAIPLTADEEWKRLEPLWAPLWELCQGSGVLLSLDTRHANTTANALAIGCDWINDVSGFADKAMIAAMQESNCSLVVMHSLGVPANPEETMENHVDAVTEVNSFFAERIAELREAGIDDERIIIDPGIGFGKTAEQSLALLWNIAEIQALDFPVLVGHSRKSFFKPFTDNWEIERDSLTRLVSHYLRSKKVDYIRVHDVAGHTIL